MVEKGKTGRKRKRGRIGGVLSPMMSGPCRWQGIIKGLIPGDTIFIKVNWFISALLVLWYYHGRFGKLDLLTLK